MDFGWNQKDYAKYSVEGLEDRLQFVRKVYSILSTQLLCTCLLVVLCSCFEGYPNFVAEHYWLYICSSVLAFVLVCVMFCFKRINRILPYNYVLLGVFTLLKALSISGTCAFYDPVKVLIAVFATFLLTLALTVYAFCSKTDFTLMRGFVVVFWYGVFLLLVFCIFFGSSLLYQYFYCPLAICAYGVYLVYDTQLIVGEKRHKLSYDDYILGAISLYIDIIGIFLHILQLIKKS